MTDPDRFANPVSGFDLGVTLEQAFEIRRITLDLFRESGSTAMVGQVRSGILAGLGSPDFELAEEPPLHRMRRRELA